MKRAVLLLALAASCSETGPRHAPFVVEVRRAGGLGELEWSPREAVTGARRFVDRIELELDVTRAPPKLALKAPGRCDTEVDLAVINAGARRVVELPAFLVANAGDAAQLGFDAPFAITLSPGCREALTGKVEWRQRAGEALETRIESNGFVLRGRTKPLADEPSWGILPLSPRTRGEHVFEATWYGGGRTETLTLRLSAAARSTGLPSIALGQRVYLGGSGWSVKAPAKNGTAKVRTADGLTSFQPDVRGRWLLVDAEERELSIMAGTHSETPLDCGRSDCHGRETKAAAETKMTTVLSRALAGSIPELRKECAIFCHATGEPGLADGGFTAVRRELGLDALWPASGAEAWDTLPRPLRRLGGVTCTACHGPGAIPEPAARWAILRSDVCAVCHDAPPEYPHVSAWKGTRMARADQDESARKAPECRPCHTTAGFLATQGFRKDTGETPPDVVLGIGCTACHAPHAAHTNALVRIVPIPNDLPGAAAGASAVCLPCHRNDAARIVYGGKTPPHVVAHGCLACHGRPPAAPRSRGEGHDFRAPEASCTRGCHDDPGKSPTGEAGIPRRDPSLRERATRLFAKLGRKLDPKRPPHAATAAPAVKDAAALADVLAVLEDPAADVHNPAYAKELLDRAERGGMSPNQAPDRQ